MGRHLQHMKNDPDVPKGPEDLRKEFVRGILYVHSRLNANTGETLEALSLLAALIELLHQKGLITLDELEAAKQTAGGRLAEQFEEKGLGILLQDKEEDKYAYPGSVKIDCASRIHLCHAACCRLAFALSKQDVQEGIVKWDLEKPYLIARGKDNYCTHIEQGPMTCSIWDKRPVPCRAFDCRRDGRIWVDFEKQIPHPDLARSDWPGCVKHEDAPGAPAPGPKREPLNVISTKIGEEVIPL